MALFVPALKVVNAAFTIYPSAISVMSYGFIHECSGHWGGLGGHVALSTKRHTYKSIGPARGGGVGGLVI